MLQYCINVFFSGTAMVAVFVVFDSCRKALNEFWLLMHERELVGPAGAEIDPGASLQSVDPKPTEGLGPKLECGKRMATSVQFRLFLPRAFWVVA